MARCPDCGNKISSLAEMCPQCGFSLRYTPALRQMQRTRRRKKILKRLIPSIVLLVIGVAVIDLGYAFLGLVLFLLGLFLLGSSLLAFIGLGLRRVR